jgi:hypothetical protein
MSPLEHEDGDAQSLAEVLAPSELVCMRCSLRVIYGA